MDKKYYIVRINPRDFTLQGQKSQPYDTHEEAITALKTKALGASKNVLAIVALESFVKVTTRVETFKEIKEISSGNSVG